MLLQRDLALLCVPALVAGAASLVILWDTWGDDLAFHWLQARGCQADHAAFLTSRPMSDHASQVWRLWDDCAFQAATEEGSRGAYARYLAAWPMGRHHREAKSHPAQDTPDVRPDAETR